jgi:hypothetical protein
MTSLYLPIRKKNHYRKGCQPAPVSLHLFSYNITSFNFLYVGEVVEFGYIKNNVNWAKARITPAALGTCKKFQLKKLTIIHTYFRRYFLSSSWSKHVFVSKTINRFNHFQVDFISKILSNTPQIEWMSSPLRMHRRLLHHKGTTVPKLRTTWKWSETEDIRCF